MDGTSGYRVEAAGSSTPSQYYGSAASEPEASPHRLPPGLGVGKTSGALAQACSSDDGRSGSTMIMDTSVTLSIGIPPGRCRARRPLCCRWWRGCHPGTGVVPSPFDEVEKHTRRLVCLQVPTAEHHR